MGDSCYEGGTPRLVRSLVVGLSYGLVVMSCGGACGTGDSSSVGAVSTRRVIRVLSGEKGMAIGRRTCGTFGSKGASLGKRGRLLCVYRISR